MMLPAKQALERDAPEIGLALDAAAHGGEIGKLVVGAAAIDADAARPTGSRQKRWP